MRCSLLSVVSRALVLLSFVLFGCGPLERFDESNHLATSVEAVCSPTTYQAETMTHSTGGAVTGGWNIWSNGFISTNHPFTAESTTITVTAQGQMGAGAWPHMIVSVNGVAIGNTTVGTATWANYAFTFNATAATQEIRVEFDNDACCDMGDRNLLVDQVVVSCDAGAGDAGTPPYKDPSLPIATRLADLMGRMTLDEKLGQMAQSEQQTSSPGDVTSLGLGSVLSGADSTLNPPSAGAWADLHDAYQNGALATRLGIPMIYGIDAVHGHAKVLGGTVFPHHMALGATRDPALVQQVGAVTAQELTATGIRWTFAPAFSVARDQRWGRAYESFGEDPALVTSLTTEISGLQGAGLGTPDSVLATAKHFVGDGGAMWTTGNNPGGTPIDRGNAQMSDAALRAIHLAPYTSAISRGVGSIMASFSSVNGTKMHANSQYLTTVLKGELGFQGFVVSDWQATDQLTGTFADQIRTAVNAGVDMFMLPNSYASFISTLRTEVQAGRVTQARIDDAVSRILKKKFEMGLFEAPLANRSGATQIGSTAHRNVARQAVRESLVLVKNTSSFLPLSPTTTVCVTGNGADNLRAQLGAWTLGWQQPLTTETGATTILQGVTQVVGASRVVASGCQVGIRVIPETLQSYAEWFGDDDDPDHDGSGTCTASGGCVVVLLGGRPMDIQPLVNDASTRAIVMAWYPGSEGLGVAEVLYGVGGANFTGKLPVTWKVDATETPVNWCDPAGVDADTNGTKDACEDTGAHYTNTASPPASVLFPYGFGLSYGAGPSCTDGVRNGTETDVDCGGSCPADCADGKLCGVNGDCTGNNCVSGTCCSVLTAPTGLSATAGNAQVNLGWTAVSGAERYNVKRSTTSGSGYATIATPTATSQLDTTVTNGTTYFYVTSGVNVCGAVSTESANSSQVSATPSAGGALPSPWLTQDIGAVAATGSASFASGTFTVSGSGADIAGTADEFRYVYQQLTGNMTIVARVNSVGNSDPLAKGGVMIRETLTAGSKMAMVYARPDRRVTYAFRTATGGAASAGASGTTPVGDTTSPKWIKLVRTGDSLTAFFSTNGTTFTQVDGAQTISMASTIFVGLAVTSRVDGTLTTATLDNVTATDMAAYYKFDEASGTTAFDSSGNGRNGTLSTGVTFTAGHLGNGVRIAGGTQFVDLPDALVQACADLTVASWVRLTTNTANWTRIFDFGNSTATYMFLTPRAGGNTLRFAGRLNSGTEQQISFAFTFPTATWQHVAVTLSGTTGRVYLNGSQVAQNAAFTLDPSGMGPSANDWLGRSQFTADARLDGTLDEMRISCRAYSATEIAALAAQ